MISPFKKINGLILSLLVSVAANSAIIQTVAGNGAGDGGPAASAVLVGPTAMTISPAGEIYFVDANAGRIRKISKGGIISTVGGGDGGYAHDSGNGGPAIAATFQNIGGIAVDGLNNIYVSDSGYGSLRKISPDGIVSAIVPGGNNCTKPLGDGGQATNAALCMPAGLIIDKNNNLYIADSINNRVRKISPDGVITTVAGGGSRSQSGAVNGDGGPATSAVLYIPNSLAIAPNGVLYIADGNTVRAVAPNGIITTVAGQGVPGYAGDGGAATLAQFGQTLSLAIDPVGTLFISDAYNQRVRKIDSSGIVSTVAGSGDGGFGGDGDFATNAAFNSVTLSLAIDAASNFYVADTNNSRIRSFTVGGQIKTIAGDGLNNGRATDMLLYHPAGTAFDAAGNMYIADFGHHCVRKIDTNGNMSIYAGTGVAGNAGDGGLATSAQLGFPVRLVFDSLGNLYIADVARIRKVTPAGIISTFAGTSLVSFGGDGGLATQAYLNNPTAMAFDKDGNFYFADTGNGRIREIYKWGMIATVAGNGSAYANLTGTNTAAPDVPALLATFYSPDGIAFDSSGNLLIADGGNGGLRKLNFKSGHVTEVVQAQNCPAQSSQTNCIGWIGDVVTNATGGIYISDSAEGRVDFVDSNGNVSVIAGNWHTDFSGDGSASSGASLNGPGGLTIDQSGNLYIADVYNMRIRKIAPTSLSPIFGASTNSVGSLQGQVLSSNIYPAQADINKPGSLFAAAFFNGGFFFFGQNGWVPYQGNAPIAYSSGPLAVNSTVIVNNMNLSGLVGAQIYLGYGRGSDVQSSFNDMVANQLFAQTYVVH